MLCQTFHENLLFLLYISKSATSLLIALYFWLAYCCLFSLDESSQKSVNYICPFKEITCGFVDSLYSYPWSLLLIYVLFFIILSLNCVPSAGVSILFLTSWDSCSRLCIRRWKSPSMFFFTYIVWALFLSVRLNYILTPIVILSTNYMLFRSVLLYLAFDFDIISKTYKNCVKCTNLVSFNQILQVLTYCFIYHFTILFLYMYTSSSYYFFFLKHLLWFQDLSLLFHGRPLRTHLALWC